MDAIMGSQDAAKTTRGAQANILRLFSSVYTLIAGMLVLAAAPASHAASGSHEEFRIRPLKNTCVAVLFGQRFNALGTGLSRFSNIAYSADVPDWNIDQDTADYLVSLLRDSGYAVTKLETGAGGVESFYGGKRAEQPNEAALLQLAGEQGCDSLIALWRSGSDIIPDLPPGFGLFEQGAFGITHVAPYAQFTIIIKDVHTGARIASKYGFPTETKPNKAIPWKRAFDEYTDDEKSLIRNGVVDHIHREVTRALFAVKVIDSREVH